MVETSLNNSDEDEVSYPRSFQLAAIITSISLATFLVALDQTIITTAIPKITDEFHSLNDISWYGSGYMLTMCSFPVVFGRLYLAFDAKSCFLASIVVFEIGSFLCGIASSSALFILGRVIAGSGGCGITVGTICFLQDSVPPSKTPRYNVIPVAIWAIAAGIGPVIGGAMADHASWRWCFYINLPIGALAAAVVARYFRPKAAAKPRDGISKGLPSAILITAAVACLLMSLQWGGDVYPWSSPRIIGLMTCSGVLLSVFVVIQVFLGEEAILPPHILKQRTIFFGSLVALSNGSCYTILTSYLPVWFQAVKDASATESGVMNMPLVMGVSFSCIAAGNITAKTKHYIPIMVSGAALCVVGTSLLTLLQPSTKLCGWFGYQTICGIGIGLVMQAPMTATQDILTKDDSKLGVAVIMFFRLIGGVCFNSIGQSILTRTLVRRLTETFPNLNISITKVGAINVKNMFPVEQLPTVVEIYNGSLQTCFYAAVAVTAFGFMACFGMKWRAMAVTH